MDNVITSNYRNTDFKIVLSVIIPYLYRHDTDKMKYIIDAVKSPEGCFRVMGECYNLYESILLSQRQRYSEG